MQGRQKGRHACIGSVGWVGWHAVVAGGWGMHVGRAIYRTVRSTVLADHSSIVSTGCEIEGDRGLLGSGLDADLV